MKKSNTRRSLLLSALSLLMCVSMLIGSTFAWFTDSVESGINKIQAGNLDIELYHGKDAEPYGNGKKVTNTTSDIFTGVDGKPVLWEPGAVAYANLNVVNEGSLVLKYQLAMNFDNENYIEGTNAKLSEVLKVAFLDNPVTGNREEILKAAKDLPGVKLTDLMKTGSLQKKGIEGDNKVYGVVIYWEPSAEDNRWNVQNGAKTSDDKPLHIDLGLKLIATQQTAEKDSFDQYYDMTAAVFTVAEANELLAANENVNLINCNDPSGILYVPSNYTGTLVLNNVTIASVQETAALSTIADGENTTAATAKEIKIVILGNVTVKATADGMSAITATKLNITGDGKLTAVAKGNHAYAIGGAKTESVKISNVTITYAEGGHAYGVGTDLKYYKDAPEGGAAIGSGLDGAVITLDKVNVVKAIGGSKTAGIGASYHTGVTVNITNSTIGYVEGGVSAAGIGGSRVSGDATESGTTINIANSTITAQGGAFGAGIGSGYDTHCNAGQPVCTINIDDSTINATGGKYAAGVGTGYHNAALAGEIKNSTVNATSGEKFYKNTYTSAMDVGFGIVDPTREGKDNTSKLLYNGKEITLANADVPADSNESLKNALKDDATVVLTSGDFTLPSLNGKKNVTIVGAADGSTKLAGVNHLSFGENTTIKGVTFKRDGNDAVRYGNTAGDVVFENCVFEGYHYGMHIDNANGGTVTFNNCTFYGRNAFAASGTYYFNSCAFKFTSYSYNSTNIYSQATFNKCTWDSKLELYIDSGAKVIIDGDEITNEITDEIYFISDAAALESFSLQIECNNHNYLNKYVMLAADIDLSKGNNETWTPMGQTGAAQFKGTFDGHGFTISNLNIDSTNETGANYSTGFFGWVNGATIKNVNFDKATVVGNHNVAVVAGYMETTGCTISNCHVTNSTVVAHHANSEACGDKVGVIVGHAGNTGVKVVDCSATNCTVQAGRDAGQIAGAALTANVTGCTATNVTVAATDECTGAHIREEIIGRVLG